MQTQDLINNIFNCPKTQFNKIVIDVFNFQYNNNTVYQKWSNLLNVNPSNISLENLPFLPISFFKTHKVVSTNFYEQQIFESSGTTKSINSCHYIKDIKIYENSFLRTFKNTYGNIENLCIIGLLPSYLERNNSSLVYMVQELIKQSSVKESGFYLYNFTDLHNALINLEKRNIKTILIGVTYALLDFAEQFPINLNNTIIMETGGMKGRKKEMTKDEVHDILKKAFNINEVHSEYGMTELLSQAYSTKNQTHICPNWMSVFVRSEEDPLLVNQNGRGVFNVIDLANIYSCSFIATDDVGEVFNDGSFKVFGRLDNSDLRGCSLLYS